MYGILIYFTCMCVLALASERVCAYIYLNICDACFDVHTVGTTRKATRSTANPWQRRGQRGAEQRWTGKHWATLRTSTWDMERRYSAYIHTCTHTCIRKASHNPIAGHFRFGQQTVQNPKIFSWQLYGRRECFKFFARKQLQINFMINFTIQL